MSTPLHPSHRRGVWFVLALVLIAGLGLRVWYASWNLTDQRYWDEKYSLDNVRPIMLDRTFSPARAYYPSPVFTLPAALLFEGSGALGRWVDRPEWAPMDGGRFTSTAILLARLLMTLYGVLTVVLVFLIGRHIGCSRVGLLAAVAIAFSPWMIHASGYYKPDALLVMAVTLAFFASLRAIAPEEGDDTVERSAGGGWARVRWYVITGIAIAVAMSAKLTGGLAAVPLIVATAHFGSRDRGLGRRVGRLVLAGVVSVVTFVALNPYWRHYLFFLSGLKRDYAMRADWAHDSRLGMPGRVVGMIVDDYGHGPIWGTLALVGFAAFAWRWGRQVAMRRGVAGVITMPGMMMLGFVLSYVAAYALQTSYFKGNNFLPLLPFTALAAAWLVDRALRAVLATLWSDMVAAVLAATLLVPAGVLYVYRSLTPTTLDAALGFLDHKIRPPGGRVVYAESMAKTKTVWEGQRAFGSGEVALQVADSLERWSVDHLRNTDGLVFRDEAANAVPSVRSRWIEGIGPHKKAHFEARLFHLRGPPVWAVFHRWTHASPMAVLETEGGIGPTAWCVARLPPEWVAGERISASVWVPHRVSEPVEGPPSLELGAQVIPLIHRQRVGDGEVYVTDRIVVGAPDAVFQIATTSSRLGEQQARLAVPIKHWSVVSTRDPTPPVIQVHVYRWRSGP